MLKALLIPTLIIEGPHIQTQNFITQELCAFFCTRNEKTSCFCHNCRRIQQHQHPSLLWICPEKDYTIDEVDMVFDKVRFSLEADERYFFVLEKTETLNAGTANRLLKLLEEPPRGYTFILLTTNKNALLPTIISRSHVISLQSTTQQAETTMHPITTYLTTPKKLDDPIGFETALKEHKLTENEAVQLCFELLETLTKMLEITTSEFEHERLIASIACIKNNLKTSPGSGSADFFLKRLFLHMPRNT